MNQEMGRLTRKSRLRLDLIVQSNPKHANEVEILDVQGKFNDGGIEHNKSITNYNDFQDFRFNYDIYNTSDVFVDKLSRSSVFIYANKNIIENCVIETIRNEIIHYNNNCDNMIQHNNSISSITLKLENQNKKLQKENYFENTYNNNVFYEFLKGCMDMILIIICVIKMKKIQVIVFVIYQ